MAEDTADYLSAAEAAALLEVKRSTLYAYVSRGRVRTAPGPSARERRYLRADVAQLKAQHASRAGHAPLAATALRWGAPVLDSAVSEVTPRGPRYRGYLATALAARATPFESVAELLWTGELPQGAVEWARCDFGVEPEGLVPFLPRGAPTSSHLAVVAAALGARELPFTAPGGEQAHARRLIRRLAAALALPRSRRLARRALRTPGVAAAVAVAFGVAPRDELVRALDCALVLCADHELNASTFGARVAASAGADVFACVCSALGVMSGPEHGAASARVEALVREVGHPRRAKAVVMARARRGELLPGFGHTLYPGGDPRAPPLFEQARALGSRDVRLRTLEALAAAMVDLGGEWPNLDAGLVALSIAAGLPAGAAAALFTIGRMAGWVAHVQEQRATGFLLRPRARYVGPARRELPPAGRVQPG